jgi:hypothetical protein
MDLRTLACGVGLVLLATGCSSSGDDADPLVFGVTATDPGVIKGNDNAVAWTLTGDGFQTGATVSVDEAGSTVANVTVVSPTQITFDLSAPNTVVAGTAQITVTNPDMTMASATVPTIPETVTLGSLVQPIFSSRCTSCHAGGVPPAGLALTTGDSHAALVGVASTQVPALQRVNAGNPAQSYLVDKIVGTHTVGVQMPPSGGPLTATQIALIREWISAGALDN